MSLINFVSGKVTEKHREERRNARKAILQKAEEEYERRRSQEERRKQRGDDQWMVPAVEEAVRQSSSSGKKHKKDKKKKEKKEKKKKKKKKKERSESSSSESSDEENWVEKPPAEAKPQERDAWMIPSADISDLLTGSSKREVKEANKEPSVIDRAGQSGRELNPYWKDGGTGLPSEEGDRMATSSRPIGDGGATWLRGALRRAREQAEEEGRSLEDVAAERWGSLKQLEEALAKAEGRSRRPAFRKPQDDGGYPSERFHSRGSDTARKGFRKPSDTDSSHSSVQSRSARDEGRHRAPHSSNWRKSDRAAVAEKTERERRRSPTPKKSSSDSEPEKESKPEKQERLNDLQMNELAAKLVKAEILGNEELISQLRTKLEAARAARAVPEEAASKIEEETVVMMRKDARGNLRPATMPSFASDHELWGGRKGRKASAKKSHDASGQRSQYFADDSRFSLQDIYQRERFTTASDQQAEFVKLAAGVDEDGEVATERAAHTSSRSADAEHGRALADSRRTCKALEDCRWCLDGRKLPKHLIAALGQEVFMCTPPHAPLVEGHCLLVPAHHVSCSTQLDEDVWEEMQKFRRAITAMFASRGLDAVFFETATHLHKMPHMVLECVPVPKEQAIAAPIYFKKAIQESETEWSMNQKLVLLKEGRGVRRAIPRGLPYFWVVFGDSDRDGFAHVIEDEKHFPRNFAQEVLGGMMELDHLLWRKPRPQNFDTQRRNALLLAEWWKPHDFTRGNKRKHSSSSSSSSESD